MSNKKRDYVERMIFTVDVETDKFFRFYDERYLANEQRSGGFGNKFYTSVKDGVFIRKNECIAIKFEDHLLGKVNKKTHLVNNEADISLAARAAHSTVLTLDNKKALNRAQKTTERVIDVEKWDVEAAFPELIRNELKC